MSKLLAILLLLSFIFTPMVVRADEPKIDYYCLERSFYDSSLDRSKVLMEQQTGSRFEYTYFSVASERESNKAGQTVRMYIIVAVFFERRRVAEFEFESVKWSFTKPLRKRDDGARCYMYDVELVLLSQRNIESVKVEPYRRIK